MIEQNNNNVMNQIGYHDPGVLFQKQQQMHPRIQQMKTDNILFVADLPDESTEEDIHNFFQSYDLKASKIIR
jgi:hypothetical protein